MTKDLNLDSGALISMATGDFGSFVTGAKWTYKLWKLLQARRKLYAAQLEELNRITFGDPAFLARYYVEPDCQEINPADRPEEDFLVSREPVFKKLAEFFRAQSFQQGNNQLFVLSDAGMGKTSLITMLKLLHMNRFWPNGKTCEVLKLGPATLQRLKEISLRRNSILLLDALDEDTESYGRVEARLVELLDATSDFNKVIITCRTQFFPVLRKDPLERPGQVVIHGYTCPTKYIANFDSAKVDQYLRKRFRPRLGFINRNGTIDRAKQLVGAMGSLRCRPMLLAHVDDLLKSPKVAKDVNEFDIYQALLQVWLDRQEAKSKVPAPKLWRVCEILANRMQSTGTRLISQTELMRFRESIREMEPLDEMDLEGRSLLNRTSEGDYRFSHYSIQEFLAAFGVLHGDDTLTLAAFRATSFIAQLILQERIGKRAAQPNRLEIVDFSEAELRHVNLRGRNLRGVSLMNHRFDGSDLSGANFTDANLAGCSFADCRFVGAVFDSAILDGASFSGADFTEASLKGVRGRRTDLSRCVFYMTNLSDSELQSCTFAGSSTLGWASLANAVIEECDFGNTDWSGPNYRETPNWGSYRGGEVMFFGKRGLHATFRSIKSVRSSRFDSASNQCEHFKAWAREEGAYVNG